MSHQQHVAVEDTIDAQKDNDPSMGDTGFSPVATTANFPTTESGEYDSGIASVILEASELHYSVSDSRPGFMLCICNTNFDNGLKLSERKGTDKDIWALKRVFQDKFGFKVDVRNNLTAGDMLSAISEVTKNNMEHFSSFAVVIMTHGKEDGFLYGTNDAIELSKLILPLKLCKELTGKPKMVFVQACRGKEFDKGMPMMADDGKDDKSSVTIPVSADFLYVFSSVDGYVSFQNPSKGSWFIQTLCKVLEENHSQLDMLAMLTRVCHTLAYKYSSITPSNPMTHNLKQISSVTTTLTKTLRFKSRC